MDSITVARSMRGSLGMLAMNWLLAPTTQKKAEEAGMGEGLRYAVGRLGVLGIAQSTTSLEPLSSGNLST